VKRSQIKIEVPGLGALYLWHLVLDYNGTLAVDGALLPGVKSRLRTLGRALELHVLTADTFGRARRELQDVNCRLAVLGPKAQDRAKAAYVRRLGARRTVCIGNGRNDRLMLRAAALGIAVVQAEGAARESVMAADVIAASVLDALDLLIEPRRLLATLRS
jgi:soluble P-type ATPase